MPGPLLTSPRPRRLSPRGTSSPLRHGASSFPWRRGGLLGFPGLERPLNLRLGINEKICARDHPFAFPQASADFIVLAVIEGAELCELSPKFDGARLEPSFSLVHEDNVAPACGHDRTDGDGKPLALPDVEPCVHEHARAQLPLRVRNVDPRTDSAFHWINERLDHRNLAAEILVTKRRHGDLYFLTSVKKWQLVLVEFCPQPDRRKIHQTHQAVASLHTHAGLD